MRKLAIYALFALIWLLGFMAGKCYAEQTYSKTDVLNAVSGIPVSGRVEHPKIVKDVTPPTPCDKPGSGVAGFGHQETTICPDGATGARDMEVFDGVRKTFWKGNPQIGYYGLRDDGSIDTSRWRSSIDGSAA